MKLQIISFVARYLARKRDGMFFRIWQDKPDYALDV
jgi:hypothetical protein